MIIFVINGINKDAKLIVEMMNNNHTLKHLFLDVQFSYVSLIIQLIINIINNGRLTEEGEKMLIEAYSTSHSLFSLTHNTYYNDNAFVGTISRVLLILLVLLSLFLILTFFIDKA